VEARDPAGNIKTASDALWYSLVTMSTVGYGDRYPVTNPGRLIGSVIIIVGVGLFGTITGFLANAFLSPKTPPEPEPVAAGAPDAEPVTTPEPSDA
jgi:voltage-gated potassium channel